MSDAIEAREDASAPEWRARTQTPERDVGQAIRRGLRLRCPACGKGHVFAGYLKVAPRCEACGLDLSQHRADDAPPYVVITIVGHLVLGAVVAMEEVAPDFPIWAHMAIWPATALILSLALLPPIKSALIAIQWSLGMHGFGAPGAKGD